MTKLLKNMSYGQRLQWAQSAYPNKDKAKGELNHSLQVTIWGMAMP